MLGEQGFSQSAKIHILVRKSLEFGCCIRGVVQNAALLFFFWGGNPGRGLGAYLGEAR